jgi:predicted RNA-binding protein (virulence factor B family)
MAPRKSKEQSKKRKAGSSSTTRRTVFDPHRFRGPKQFERFQELENRTICPERIFEISDVGNFSRFAEIIDNRHWGMIYKNQLFRPIRVGDRSRGWVRKITEDMRIDVSLQQTGLAEVETSVVKLEAMLREHGGVLAVNDKSDPQDVARLTGMSKKVFKRALGMLLKAGKVEQTENGIKAKK